MSGMTNFGQSFLKSFNEQVKFQERVTGAKCPSDNTEQFKYHVVAMVEEMGEVVRADKRWKTHRNTRYEHDEKVDEIADVFITAMNLAIHSGMNVIDVENAIANKIAENFRRLEEVEVQDEK